MKQTARFTMLMVLVLLAAVLVPGTVWADSEVKQDVEIRGSGQIGTMNPEEPGPEEPGEPEDPDPAGSSGSEHNRTGLKSGITSPKTGDGLSAIIYNAVIMVSIMTMLMIFRQSKIWRRKS